MSDDFSKIIALLSRMTVFKPLKRSELETLAKGFEILSLTEGEALIQEGEIGEEFYIIFSGRFQVLHESEGGDSFLGFVAAGDFIGEEALLYGGPRAASIIATMPSKVLRLSYENFAVLINNHPSVIPYFAAIVESRRLSRETHFDWLGQEETIYLLVRKEHLYLYYKLLWPFLSSFLAWPFVIFAVMVNSGTLQWFYGLLGVSIFLIAIAFGVWQYIDWGNDYYIVTNERVVWLEKVIGLYDSREEAPLSTVVAVNVQTEALGRWLGFGDVSVRTYTGSIVMRHVAHPAILAGLVEELVGRGKQDARRAETEAIERTIRTRLGLPGPSPSSSAAKSSSPSSPPMSTARKMLADFFKMRYEEGKVVTFRKHWMVLLWDTFWPNVFLFIGVVLLIFRLLGLYIFVSTIMVFELWFVFTLFLLVWWVYGYVDWRNDIYQVTNDTIIDISRKPLGEETKKTASIDNILSLQHARKGLIHLLFNFGDVIAVVGVDTFTFENVFNPSEVEHEIFHRIAQRKRREHEAEIIEQREYIADWLAAYHRQVSKPSGNPPETG